MMRQPVAGDRLARLDREGAALETAEVFEGSFRQLHPGQHGASLGQEHGAGFGQLDPAPNAVEQLGAMPGFKRRDRGAGRRLGKVQGLGGPRDVLAFGDGDEDAKLFERHTASASKSAGMAPDSRQGEKNRLRFIAPRSVR